MIDIDLEKPIYGIACDIGTTTVALNLVSLKDGKVLSSAARFNQQLKCGEDIISRINYTQQPGRLQELHALIVRTINQLIEQTIKAVSISPTDIYYVSITGNTMMIHLFIDIGTNGELVVGNRNWLMTCACSAGPAFEGGAIRCGMPATTGAIEKITIRGNEQLEYKVIGNGKPKGLWGSGLIDLLAELYMHGYIDRYGKFHDQTKIIHNENEKGFLIETGKNSYWGKDLILTENDISTLIRTKGAVFAACALLLKYVGISFDQIDAFYIASGFDKHLNIENAVRIGLLPDLERDKFHYLGNSSLIGAYLILLSNKNRQLVNEIAEKRTYIELNTEPGYMNEYTGALFLPHTNYDLFPSVKNIHIKKFHNF